MGFTEIIREERRPYLQLLFLGIFVLVGMIVGQLVGFLIGLLIFGTDLLHNTGWTTGNDVKYTGALKIIVFTSQIGTFLVPAFAMCLMEAKKPAQFFALNKPKLNFLLFVLLIMVCATPFIGYATEINQKMQLPGFLSWMKDLEEQGEATMKGILNMKSIGDFLLCLFLVAVVPAVCEEFLFRGALQRTLLRIKINQHVAIWLGAAIFSAFHLQFFGFLPRMFLGAALGYIYFFTGSLWYNVFGHFLNNAYYIAFVYYYRSHNLDIKEAEKDSTPLYLALISAILTLALFKFLKDRSTSQNAIPQPPEE